jgi:hypothetical protein
MWWEGEATWSDQRIPYFLLVRKHRRAILVGHTIGKETKWSYSSPTHNYLKVATLLSYLLWLKNICWYVKSSETTIAELNQKYLVGRTGYWTTSSNICWEGGIAKLPVPSLTRIFGWKGRWNWLAEHQDTRLVSEAELPGLQLLKQIWWEDGEVLVLQLPDLTLLAPVEERQLLLSHHGQGAHAHALPVGYNSQ